MTDLLVEGGLAIGLTALLVRAAGSMLACTHRRLPAFASIEQIDRTN